MGSALACSLLLLAACALVLLSGPYGCYGIAERVVRPFFFTGVVVYLQKVGMACVATLLLSTLASGCFVVASLLSILGSRCLFTLGTARLSMHSCMDHVTYSVGSSITKLGF